MAELEVAGIAVRSLSLLGVAVCAVGVLWPRFSAEARQRCFVMGAAGVALAFANPMLSLDVTVVVMNAAYVLFTGAVFAAGAIEAGVFRPREAPPAPQAAEQREPPLPSWDMEAPREPADAAASGPAAPKS